MLALELELTNANASDQQKGKKSEMFYELWWVFMDYLQRTS